MVTKEIVMKTGQQSRIIFWVIVVIVFLGILGVPSIFGIGVDATFDNSWLLSLFLIFDVVDNIPAETGIGTQENLLIWVSFISFSILYVAMLWQIDRLFQKFSQGKVFTNATVGYFKIMGYLSIAIFICEAIFNNFMNYIIIPIEETDMIMQENEFADWVVSLDFTYLIIGIFILTVSRVMALGVMLQDDADATI